MSIEVHISGFLFLFIILTNVAKRTLGYKIDDDDAGAKLQQIVYASSKFQISVVLAIIEHLAIISLALMPLVAFSSYNLILGIVWATFRTVEGLIQLYSEVDFWGPFNLAIRYVEAGEAENQQLRDVGRVILRTRNLRYRVAMILLAWAPWRTPSFLSLMASFHSLSDGSESSSGFSMSWATQYVVSGRTLSPWPIAVAC